MRILLASVFLASVPGGLPGADETSADAASFSEKVPGTSLRIEMVPVPGNERAGDDAIEPFWMARTEIPWEVYDAFVFQLDKPHSERQTVTETRPTKPYTLADRGYGHNGYPALSMSLKGANAFCTWLSEKTGRTYRVPTEAEWEHMYAASGLADPELPLAEHAWFKTNAKAKTRPVGKREPDQLGLCDVLGNVAEWCIAADGKGVVRGGSFRDETVGFDSRLEDTPAWNATDPQLPKSPWWLADADFVGFRILCEGPAPSSD